MKKRYYFFYLEIALKTPGDLHIYAFENVSHVPTKKLIEIFNIDLAKDPYISKGYFLTKANFRKHKKFITQNMVQINIDIFEYTLQLYATDNFKEIRKLYKKDPME